MAESALADDLTIGNSTAVTTPQATATAANGTPGDITTQLGSVIRIDTPGAALTLNSNNDLDLSGLIENTTTQNGGIGVHILGGFAGNFTAQGSAGSIINVTGSGTGNYGLLLDGSAPFIGNVTFQPGSAMIVYGENSVGVAIETALNGNLQTGSAIQGTGVGTTGVRIAAPITGSYINSGPISIRGLSTFTLENVDPLSGSGIEIGASIDKGFLNAGPVTALDSSTPTGRITTSSNLPAVVIAPSVAGLATSSITLGAFVGDTARLNFSFMNRGVITASENDTGISTTGMRIGETGDTMFTTLLTNGFYNRGSIVASSQSDNLVSTNATAVPTNATGLVIGNQATVNAFNTSATSGYAFVATAITGTTTSALTLGADASNVDGVYDGMPVVVNGVLRTIVSYDVTRDSNGAIISKIATLDNPLVGTPDANTKVTITSPNGWPTKASTGSTATTVNLGSDASAIDGIYDGFAIQVGGETRIITSYEVVRDASGNIVSKTATLDSALSSAPGEGAGVAIRVPPTTAVALSTNASDISGVYNGFTITAGGDTRNVSDYVVIFDPETSQPVMRVAKIGNFLGGSNPWGTIPANGASIAFSTSAMFNSGSITASMNGNKGGFVTALLIQAGGTLPSLTNYGAITAAAGTTDTSISGLSAVAINDQSGTLNTIFNHGAITANATKLDGNTQVAIAADLSHSASAQRFYVLSGGDVTGDIVFGSAPVDVNSVAQNQLIVEGSVTRTTGNTTVVDHSTVFGGVRATGDGSLDIDISMYGSGGVLRTSNVRATTLDVGPNGRVGFALDRTTGSAPLITTTGNVTFYDHSDISVTPTSFLPANGTYTLIAGGAPGTVRFANFGTTADLGAGSPFPFLYEGTFTADGKSLNAGSGTIVAQTLNLTLRRKTAAELGLTGNNAAIYEPLAAAALGDDGFGAALLTLDSAAEVEAALATTVPDIAGGMRALTVAMTDQATGVIGARQRSLLTAPEGTRNEFRFWGQEFYNNVSLNSTAETKGYGGAGQGVAVGVEWGAVETGRFGVGYTFFSSQQTERHPRETKTNGDWNMISAYGAWRFGDFFVAPQVNVGAADFKTRRAIIVSDVLGRQTNAKQKNYLAAGGATAGYIIELGNIDIIPTIAVDMMYLNQGSYSEVGGGGMNLQLQSTTQTSVRSFAGVIGQGSYAFNEGAFMPQVLAGWTHEFANDPITIDGSFESSPGSPFHLVGPTLDANKVVGGMSLGYVMRNWSAGFNYDAAASQGSLAHAATFSISSRF